MQPRTGVLYKEKTDIMEISCTTRVDNIKQHLHAHSGVQFVWLENFSGDFQSGEALNQASSSDICMIGQYIPHRLISHSAQIFAVNVLLEQNYFLSSLSQTRIAGFSPKKCDFLSANIEELQHLNILHVDKYEREALHQLTASMLQECQQLREGYQIILQSMMQEFIVRLIRSIPNRAVERWDTVEDVCRYLKENMADPFDLTHIAQEFGFNKSHLCRLFRKMKNMTMYEYLIHIRCARALEMMQDSQLSITEISQIVGFPDYAQFWRCFKQCTGASPNKFRMPDLQEKEEV